LPIPIDMCGECGGNNRYALSGLCVAVHLVFSGEYCVFSSDYYYVFSSALDYGIRLSHSEHYISTVKHTTCMSQYILFQSLYCATAPCGSILVTLLHSTLPIYSAVLPSCVSPVLQVLLPVPHQPCDCVIGIAIVDIRHFLPAIFNSTVVVFSHYCPDHLPALLRLQYLLPSLVYAHHLAHPLPVISSTCLLLHASPCRSCCSDMGYFDGKVCRCDAESVGRAGGGDTSTGTSTSTSTSRLAPGDPCGKACSDTADNCGECAGNSRECCGHAGTPTLRHTLVLVVVHFRLLAPRLVSRFHSFFHNPTTTFPLTSSCTYTFPHTHAHISPAACRHC
jgi:hypothetical protein